MPRPRRKSKEKENDAPPAGSHTVVSNGDRDRVAQRAYELYLARGGADGRDMDDWLLAEGEIRGRAERESDES
jgi:hypothetical protein